MRKILLIKKGKENHVQGIMKCPSGEPKEEKESLKYSCQCNKTILNKQNPTRKDISVILKKITITNSKRHQGKNNSQVPPTERLLNPTEDTATKPSRKKLGLHLNDQKKEKINNKKGNEDFNSISELSTNPHLPRVT